MSLKTLTLWTLKGHAGWTLHQPAPGTFVWTSPLGGRYEIEPEPILPPLPDTRPGPDDPCHDEAAPPGPDSLIMYGPDPPPLPPADEPEHVDLDTPPPF